MIIYTCITNGYDSISEDNYYDPDVQYVCFYDGKLEKKGPWEFIKLDLDIECPVRRSYHPKHLPHHYFDEEELTVWVDGCYVLTQEFTEFSKNIFLEHDFCLQKHPDQRSLLAEFSKLYFQGFSTADEILEMAAKIKDLGYTLLDYYQTINCAIWRKICPTVNEWNDLWREWYDSGVNRDQISSSVAEFLISKNYKSPLRYVVNKVSPQLNLKLSITREKKYKEAYNIHKIPVMKERISLLDKLKEIFGEPVDTFTVNRMYACVRYTPFELNNYVEKKDMVVYTCITNGYDEFVPLNYYDPDVRYVCFHDGTIDTTVGPWEYIDIRDYHQEECPRRLSFFPKANPHIWFPNGTNTIWIDGCYQHTREFINRSRGCFPFTMLRHASKFSYFDEMLEGFTCAFFSYEDAIYLTKELKKINYNFRTYGSPLGTIVWRTMSDQMTEFNKLWYEWSLVGCNRDQISFDVALRLSNVDLPSVYEHREHSGIPLGYFNKKGRKGMHPQRGDKSQYLRQEEFLNDLEKLTGLNPKLYTGYPAHDFYMKVYDIIQ